MSPVLARVFLAGFRRRKFATLLSVVAIALGVALGLAVHLIHRAALDEFAHGMRVLAGEADLQVVGPRSGFDDALYPVLALHPGVREASAIIELETRVAGSPRSLRIIGADVLRTARFGPALVPAIDDAAEGRSDRLAAFEADAIFLSPAARAALEPLADGRLELVAGTELRRVRVAGSLPGAGVGKAIALMDIAAVQRLFGWQGRISRVDLRLSPGVDPAAFARALQPLLPAGVQALPPDSSTGQVLELSRAYRVNLTMLAAIALLTGAFLVFSTQLLAVSRRRQEFAFLLALGLERNTLQRALLIEGGVLGSCGGLLGVGLAHLLAATAFSVVGGDLGAGYFADVAPRLSFDPAASALYLLLGTGAGVAGSWLPARLSATMALARAMRAGSESSLLDSVPHGRVAAVCALLAPLSALLPPIDGVPVGGYMSVALIVVGAVVVLPHAARFAMGLWPERGGEIMRLARARLVGAPAQAQVAAAGIVASATLAVAMAIMVASFRHSVDDWLFRVLPADLYASPSRASHSGFLTARQLEDIARLPGVRSVQAVRFDALRLSPERHPVTLIARPVDGGRGLPLVGRSLDRAAWGGRPPVWVSEATADLFATRVGDTLRLPIRAREVEFVVAGVWRDYARQYGSVVLELDDYRRLSGDSLANDAGLLLAPDARPAEVAAALRALLGDAVEIAAPGEIRRRSLEIFDRTFLVTYLMELVAVLIGLFGVSTSFAALATARRKEFGVLRHLGLTRAAVGRLLALEGALTALLGTLIGVLAGGGVAVVLVEVINRQSFHWSMDLHVPLLPLAGFCIAMTALAALAARISARAAMQRSAVVAVREDW